MEVAFDANGYPYDTYTGNYVNIAYDENGNAYDAVTNQTIDSIIPPDRSTVYQSPTASTVQQILQTIRPVITPTYQQPYGGQYPPSPPTYQQPYGAPYGSTYRGPGVAVTASPSQGVGLNVSPTTLLLIGVVAFAFIFGKGRR